MFNTQYSMYTNNCIINIHSNKKQKPVCVHLQHRTFRLLLQKDVTMIYTQGMLLILVAFACDSSYSAITATRTTQHVDTFKSKAMNTCATYSQNNNRQAYGIDNFKLSQQYLLGPFSLSCCLLLHVNVHKN